MVKVSVEKLKASVESLPWYFSLLASYVHARYKNKHELELILQKSHVSNLMCLLIQHCVFKCVIYIYPVNSTDYFYKKVENFELKLLTIVTEMYFNDVCDWRVASENPQIILEIWIRKVNMCCPPKPP